MRTKRTTVTVFAAVAWLLAIVAGTTAMLNYSTKPGSVGEIPVQWPADTEITRDGTRPTLVVFAHPHCPCTRATLAELEHLMADCRGEVTAQVWFIKPAGTADNWTNTSLWRAAAAIPGVSVHEDVNEVEASRFQALTSGQALLYDGDGKLLFRGGITIARGHEGENPGLSTMEDVLHHLPVAQVQTPVFGCPLFSPKCQPIPGAMNANPGL